MKKPVNAKLFTPFDIAFWGGLDLTVTGLAVGASLTKQDPPVEPVGWIILWTVVAGFWGITALYFRRRWVHIKNLRFILDPPGFVVGWEDDQYCVSAEQVQMEYDDLIAKMSTAYPNAASALRGCIVWFREPTFIQATPGFVARKVAGVQDGMLIVVGWQADLKSSALKHELAHRVLQVYAGDPVESAAHEMMAKLASTELRETDDGEEGEGLGSETEQDSHGCGQGDAGPGGSSRCGREAVGASGPTARPHGPDPEADLHRVHRQALSRACAHQAAHRTSSDPQQRRAHRGRP